MNVSKNGDIKFNCKSMAIIKRPNTCISQAVNMHRGKITHNDSQCNDINDKVNMNQYIGKTHIYYS